MKYRFILLLTAFFLKTLWLSAQTISWTQIEPGVWKGVAGQPEAFNLLSAAGVKPYGPGLRQMGDAAFPLDKREIAGRVSDGKTYLRFPLQRGEQLFGFGLAYYGQMFYRVACVL